MTALGSGHVHSLLAAILRAPDGDLVHHAAYADALRRVGDPRGELIAIELALAGSPEQAELQARRAALRATHGPVWWPGVPTHHVRTRHGFVEAIAVMSDQIELAVELARVEPLRSIELRGPIPAEVFTCLPPVRELVAREISDAGLEALFAAPCAETLVALDIGACEALSFAPRRALPKCRRLSIASTWIEEGGLIDWAHAGELRELDVSLPRDGFFDAASVVAAMPRLEVLRASCVEHLGLPAEHRLAKLVAHCTDVSRFADALRATEVVSVAPERASLDLVGDELVFDAAGAVHRNGARLPMHVQFTQWDSIASVSQRLRDDRGTALLLIEAIACGAPRILTATGCRFHASLLPRDNQVTATIEVHDTHVEIDVEHYID